MAKNSLYLPTYLKALSVMVFIIVLVFLLIVGKSLLIPFFLSAFFAVLFTPLSNWLESKKFPRVLSTLISMLAMITFVASLIIFVFSTIANFRHDFQDVSGKIDNYIGEIDSLIYSSFGVKAEIAEKANGEYFLSLLNQNTDTITNFALGAVGSLSGILLIVVFMFFLLLYRDHFVNVILKIYRDSDAELVESRIVKLRKLLINYIVGVVKVMGILVILNLIAFTSLGIKHAIFFAVIGAILNIIPYVGPFIGALLPMAYSFLTKDSLFYPIAVIVCYQIIQFIEGNILTPKIVGGNVNLNPFITIVGLLIGASIWGVAGMILIIPVMALLRQIFEWNEDTKPFAILLGEEKSNKKELKLDNED
ncbi:MAG: putative PurR-regulated permease PerM [Algoriphagus sp.]|jgi:predicted PurR-regulated permease PerM